METLAAIESRFSAKSFLDKSISWQNIERVLKAAIQAPNAGNLQSFRFILISEEPIKEKLAEACYKQSWIAQAPIIIVICSSNADLETHYHDAAVKYASQDASAAAENLILSATDMGIQSCWVSAFNEDEVKMLLRIPQSATPHIIIPLGYSSDSQKQKPRHHLEFLLYFNEYGISERKPSAFPLDKNIPKLKKQAKKLASKVKSNVGEKLKRKPKR